MHPRRTLLDEGRNRIKFDWPEFQEFTTDVHPPFVVSEERKRLSIVVVFVAVNRPVVPVLWNVLGSMRAEKSIIGVFENARIHHRKRSLLGPESDIVIAPNQEVTADLLEGLDSLSPVLHIHRHVTQMDENRIVVDRLVMTIEECLVHLTDTAERTVTVLDDIRMAEVMVGD